MHRLFGRSLKLRRCLLWGRPAEADLNFFFFFARHGRLLHLSVLYPVRGLAPPTPTLGCPGGHGENMRLALLTAYELPLPLPSGDASVMDAFPA